MKVNYKTLDCKPVFFPRFDWSVIVSPNLKLTNRRTGIGQSQEGN